MRRSRELFHAFAEPGSVFQIHGEGNVSRILPVPPEYDQFLYLIYIEGRFSFNNTEIIVLGLFEEMVRHLYTGI